MQSDIDKKQIAQFRKRYPGWDLIRNSDGSMTFVQPTYEAYKKLNNKNIIYV
jgi:hypothetical protein